ncbi:hypothetical protein TIFTF001_013962 [Ficus carica]|uniref:Uncharacterized protein n=1 Tax=Ficus carica TaxID=3494 RepID=A0AA88AIU5_FICCA|nr:hypothetical protein TIFTF001_013962 [Ficus carica]
MNTTRISRVWVGKNRGRVVFGLGKFDTKKKGSCSGWTRFFRVKFVSVFVSSSGQVRVKFVSSSCQFSCQVRVKFVSVFVSSSGQFRVKFRVNFGSASAFCPLPSSRRPSCLTPSPPGSSKPVKPTFSRVFRICLYPLPSALAIYGLPSRASRGHALTSSKPATCLCLCLCQSELPIPNLPSPHYWSENHGL